MIFLDMFSKIFMLRKCQTANFRFKNVLVWKGFVLLLFLLILIWLPHTSHFFLGLFSRLCMSFMWRLRLRGWTDFRQISHWSSCLWCWFSICFFKLSSLRNIFVQTLQFTGSLCASTIWRLYLRGVSHLWQISHWSLSLRCCSFVWSFKPLGQENHLQQISHLIFVLSIWSRLRRWLSCTSPMWPRSWFGRFSFWLCSFSSGSWPLISG